MGDECLESIKSKNKDISEVINIRWDNIIRLINYYRRILIKKGYKDFEKTHIMFEITSNLKMIAQGYRFIAWKTSTFKKSYGKDALEEFERVNESFDKFCKLFFEFNNEKALEIIKDREKITEKINEIEKNTNEDAFLYILLRQVIVDLTTSLENRIALEI